MKQVFIVLIVTLYIRHILLWLGPWSVWVTEIKGRLGVIVGQNVGVAAGA